VAKIVLVADNDAQVRKALCELFEHEADYDLCEQARNGKEAIEIATRCHPDLIVLDFSMPVMSGVAAAKQLKKLMPDVPIILFTMHDKAVLRQVSDLSSVIDRIVPKTEMADLLSHVRNLAPV
jgi:DNA-binding NarL/FixJ family response regulator